MHYFPLPATKPPSIETKPGERILRIKIYRENSLPRSSFSSFTFYSLEAYHENRNAPSLANLILPDHHENGPHS